MPMKYKKRDAKAWAREDWHGLCNVIIPSYSLDLKRLNEKGIRHDVRRNIECGFWLWARRAATDLAGILASCANNRLADAQLSICGMNAALRIADLIVEAATLSEEADLAAQSFEDRVRT